MRFLTQIDALHTLAMIARTWGFPESTHVTWLGLRSRQDWALVRRAIDEDYVPVTNDKADFTPLMEREPVHPGLVCVNVAYGLMSLTVQQELFEHALRIIADNNLAGQVLEVKLMSDRTIRVDRYPLISTWGIWISSLVTETASILVRYAGKKCFCSSNRKSKDISKNINFNSG